MSMPSPSSPRPPARPWPRSAPRPSGPFYTPVSFGAFAGPFVGHHFQPVRKTPLHDWAEEQGAVFVETGLWLRSSWFPLPDEEDWLDSVIREVKAVRERVGLCDVSTLGKIDVQGPDAAEFLNRLYCNGFKHARRSARRATASCCARTASSSTTARRRGSAKIISS